MLFNYALASLALTSCAYATPLKTIVTRQAAAAANVTGDVVFNSSVAPNVPVTPIINPATQLTTDNMEKLSARVNFTELLSYLSLNGFPLSDLNNMAGTYKLGAAPSDGKICLADIMELLRLDTQPPPPQSPSPQQKPTWKIPGNCTENDWSEGVVCSDNLARLGELLDVVSRRTNIRLVRLPSQSGGFAQPGRTLEDGTLRSPGTEGDFFDPSGVRVALVTAVTGSVDALDPERTDDAPERGNAAGGNGEGAGSGSNAPRPGNAPASSPAPGDAPRRGGNSAQRPRPNAQSVGPDQGYGAGESSISSSSATQTCNVDGLEGSSTLGDFIQVSTDNTSAAADATNFITSGLVPKDCALTSCMKMCEANQSNNPFDNCVAFNVYFDQFAAGQRGIEYTCALYSRPIVEEQLTSRGGIQENENGPATKIVDSRVFNSAAA